MRPNDAATKAGVLSRLQRGLEATYLVEPQQDVEAFVVSSQDREKRLASAPAGSAEARRPAEQLLVQQSNDDLRLGLYIDSDTLDRLHGFDPAQGLSSDNFTAFVTALEGVSHFVYVSLCAAADRGVSALELELQAEVDKFVTCLLTDPTLRAQAPALLNRLYDDPEWDPQLGPAERSRYLTANHEARRYAQTLEGRFIRQHRFSALLDEVRRFYRLSLGEKLGHIARTAA